MAVFLLALVSCVPPETADGPSVHYVQSNVAPGGDGTSWEKAFSHPQDALDIASAGDQVWVAEGEYGPRGSNDRNVIVLVPGVSVFGGFSGTEVFVQDRNPQANVTTLDGRHWAYHVVLAIGTDGAVLDGFTITGGKASGYLIETPKGGTSDGAGLFCAFSDIEIRNCRFTENEASHKGGGIFIEDSDPVLVDCVFENNRSNCYGGGFSSVGSSPTIINTIFNGNRSESSGGAVNNLESVPTFVNSVFSGNFAVGTGGAVLDKLSYSVFSNCTFNGNRSDQFSGGAIFLNQGRARLINSILWGDLSADSTEISLSNGGEARVLYSIVQGGFEGTENFASDPGFLMDGAWDTEGQWTMGDYTLKELSPAIDSGTPEGAPNFDLVGTPRPQELAYDRGAYEHKAEAF